MNVATPYSRGAAAEHALLFRRSAAEFARHSCSQGWRPGLHFFAAPRLPLITYDLVLL